MKREGDRRRIERRKGKPGVNIRYEDKDKPADWKPKRIRRGEQPKKQGETNAK
jgi:hypothetical protein